MLKFSVSQLLSPLFIVIIRVLELLTMIVIITTAPVLVAFASITLIKSTSLVRPTLESVLSSSLLVLHLNK